MAKVPPIYLSPNWKGPKPTKASLAESARENKAMAKAHLRAERLNERKPRKHDEECDCPKCNNFEP